MQSQINEHHKLAAQALWYTAPKQAELRQETLPILKPTECRVRMLYSGISRGTESLVFSGLVPQTEWQRMRCPFQAGEFSYPVKYGYCAVGVVEQGNADMIGKTVFSLSPHQTHINLSTSALTILPDNLPPKRAILIANMETALNAIWDAAPSIADRILVVGAGVVGCLVAYLCGQIAGTDITLVDIDETRQSIATHLGVKFTLPEKAPKNCDLVVHASGHPAGLRTALLCAGNQATVLELSWYGTKEVSIPLGEAFHVRRLKLISSQVGQIATSHRARWDFKRRLAAAINLLNDSRLDVLISDEIAFEDLPAHLPKIFDPNSKALAPLVSYQTLC
jgi:2-desacetyl-2-hydroxyethyl bacteriochlorophyllide A dehydrogenase